MLVHLKLGQRKHKILEEESVKKVVKRCARDVEERKDARRLRASLQKGCKNKKEGKKGHWFDSS